MYRFLYDNNLDRLDNVAMTYFDRRITYSEMFSNINKVANSFAAHGIKAGDIVSIVSLNTPETVYCIYALNFLGAVANLIIATITPQEIIENLETSESVMIIVLDKLLEKIGGFDIKIPMVVLTVAESVGGFNGIVMKLTRKIYKSSITYKSFIETHSLSGNASESSDASAPAIIVYTSGSTGIPKGVVLSNNNMNSCAWQCFVSGKDYKDNETFLNILPPFFCFGISMLHVCLYSGMTEIICIEPKINNIQNMIKKYRPSRLVLGPAFTDVVELYNGNDFSSLVDITGGGGSISLEKERKLNNILLSKNSNSKYLVGYGMTEASAAISMNFNDRNKEQSIGLPLPFTNIKIIDLESGVELGYDQEGEMLVSSPGIMVEYYKNKSETDSTIEVINGERWLHTGDLARIDEDGFIFITGRLKRIFITIDEENIAYKLFPRRMEEVVAGCALVNKCGVIVVPDEKRQNVPVIFATVENKNLYVDEIHAKEEIQMLINKRLPSYYLPKKIVLVEQIPVTPSQKIDYRELEKMYMSI